MERYPEIGDHVLIGDLQTSALVIKDGTIDWFCCPRFDSPSSGRAAHGLHDALHVDGVAIWSSGPA